MTIQPGTGYGFTSSSRGITLNVEQSQTPFQPLPPSQVLELFTPHPFRIVKLESLSPLGGGFFYNLHPDAGTSYTVIAGTVNAVPCLPYAGTAGAELTYVYVQTYPNADIQILVSGVTLDNSDSRAYVLIGTVTAGDKNQYVKSNLLRERFKLGQAEAQYHHTYVDLV